MAPSLPVGKVPPDLLQALVYPNLGAHRPDVLVHAQLGEDCATIEFGDEVAVLTTDPITGAGEDLGWYAVVVATNDLAAAGADPVALTLTLLLAPGRAAEDLRRVMRDASAAAKHLGVEIAGGHTEVTSGIDRTLIVVTAVGRARKDRVLRSGGALPGGALLITKGAGIEGTAILASTLEDRLTRALGEPAVRRAKAYRDSISVLPEARAAAQAGARAMHDVTEGGVLGAAYEMAAAAGIGVRVDAGRVPVLPETAAICGTLGIDPLGLIGSGALLVAAPDAARTTASIIRAGVQAGEIGQFVSRDRLLVRAGREMPLPPPAGDELWRVLERPR
ncbi:MAG: AIR synthase [Bacillati bacterium ANGP1]|uniref:AIR synthase n=1 Tax=Candidatus Segetimicrobium genomatis TaxID=2569760 RepID=A0A537LK10_9BACT|nr:MAG: AIR synthase [Terrabacteria group bacterium ANGP1]